MQTTTDTRQYYAALPAVLSYPSGGYRQALFDCVDALKNQHPAAADLIGQFARLCEKFSNSDLEELFTCTFDLAPQCSPYLSPYIYGEDSLERGGLMAKLIDVCNFYRVDLQGELPDHLNIVLRLAEKVPDSELADLAQYLLLKPVNKMANALESSQNPYALVLRAIERVLLKDLEEVILND